MTNNPLVEALRTIQVNFCRMNCPHGAEQNWPHDPACETLRQSVAALASSAPATGEREQIVAWQDIASAPKDGTHVLLYEGTGDTYRGAWSDSRECWLSFCGQHVTETPEPELWMPYPHPERGDHRTQSGEMEGGEHG